MGHLADVADVEISQAANTPPVRYPSYPAIEKVLQNRLSLQGNERRQQTLSYKPQVHKQQDRNEWPTGQMQQCRVDSQTECSLTTMNENDGEDHPINELAQHMCFVRCWYQERKHATSVATKAACKMPPSKLQMWQGQLLELKYRRLLSAWHQVALSSQQKHLQLLSWQKAFQARAQDIWHAHSMGFEAAVIVRAEGPYGLAAAFYAWRRRSAVLFAWALLVLGCNTASTVDETSAVQIESSHG